MAFKRVLQTAGSKALNAWIFLLDDDVGALSMPQPYS